MGGGGPNFGSERTVELFYGKLLLPPPHTPSLQLRLYVIIPWPLTVYLICTRNASVNSSCGQSPPPGYCGTFTHLVSPRGGASGRNSGSLKVKTVVALVPQEVAHPQPHHNSTRKCAWIGERIIVIKLSSSEAHLSYHWQVFLP